MTTRERRGFVALGPVAAAAAPVVLAGSGVLNLLSLLGGPHPWKEPAWLWRALPLDYVGLPRSATLLLGLALALCAVHLAGGKRRAWRLGLALCGVSAAFHAWRAEPVEFLASATLAGILIAIRDRFSLGSGQPDWKCAARRAAGAVAISFLYGSAGFWLLETREFGEDFHWLDSVTRTARFLATFGDAGLRPLTPYANWFLDSVALIHFASLLYAGFVLFRPVAYRFQPRPREQELAASIAARHGRSAQDFFKHFPDKSYFFSASGESFIAYRVAGKFAIALGDPVGPGHELVETVESFVGYCRRQGWHVAFHQVYPDRLAVYVSLGFRRMKIGDEAVLDVSGFSLEGSARKEFRNSVNRMKRGGFRVIRLEPPIDAATLGELADVSDAWLRLPGHRERRFTLGRFDEQYVQSTTVYAARDESGRVAAFLNLVPSYQDGLAAVDLMRRRPDAPNGIMDFLFAEVFLDLKARGCERFSLGMAPAAALQGSERETREERMLRWLLKSTPFLFRADTLRRFKAKYASRWEPRYSVYRRSLELPRFALALRRISEFEPMSKAG